MKVNLLRKLQPKSAALLTVLTTVTVGVAACETNQTAEVPEETAAEEQAAVQGGGEQDFDLTLNGAGASFPAPLYQRWFSVIQEEVYPGLRVNYQSVGSGAGVEQYIAGTVDFGATDAPLTDEERQQFQEQYGADPIQVPMTGGAVVFAYNLPEVEGELQLTRDAYCGIVTGEVDSWDAAAIAEANPDLALPSEPINFVHRSDGSGTTFLFTSHIQAACPNWDAGAAKTVDWPVGTGAQGNEGIAAQVQQTEGAIGYVEYAYANENNISMATLENQAGNFIEPTPEAASEVFAGVDVPQDFALTIPDPEGDQAYPIAGLTWLLLYPEYDEPVKAEAIEAMVDWALNNGDSYAQELGYVPLPQEVAQRVQDTVESQIAGIEPSSASEVSAAE